jgi:DNA-binding CsgD family transcriptional regulator
VGSAGKPCEPLGQPPVPVAEQFHRGGEQDGADDDGVEQDGDGKANAANLGAALRRGNQRAEARQHLRASLELAQRLGANLLSEEAHEELIAAGAQPGRLVLSGADALTPSERRTAAMAAEGLSNREIAQALFVSLRTVEMHLSNAFRKLDVSSRTQLPAALTAGDTPVAAGA